LSTARINDRLLPHLLDSRRSDVVAVGSRERERADSYARDRDIPRAYGSYEALLADPSIDVVYVSVPNPEHVTWSLAALDAGKHVVVEKPIALQEKDVEVLATVAADRGLIVQEASMMMFSEPTRQVVAMVRAGRIGRPIAAQGIFTFKLAREGDIRLWSEGGGSLWDVGVYPVTLFNTLFDGAPTDVQGLRVLGRSVAVDMTFAGQMRYESGVVAQLLSSMDTTPTWSAQILGEDGSITLDQPWCNMPGDDADVAVKVIDRNESVVTFGDEVGAAAVTRFAAIDAYRDEVQGIEAMILDGEPSPHPIERSRESVRTIAALIEACSTSH
jgi:D-xylose 1-dehydrogenase (NADP+, D-xylono-1,5-lactone-forming)